ncbi:MAG: cytochrome c maturation protein CcmE [Alphaproteobacteria bacterium]|nr:cytochrome c maturation protein CcmE [Alphaproteobacteria bacterium]
MTPQPLWQARHTRLVLILSITVGIALAVGLTLMGLSQNVTYFYAPTDIVAAQEKLLKEQKPIRLGGLVEKGSIVHGKRDATEITFVVTDLKETVTVHYKGITPDLFREGQGVVAQGTLSAPGEFTATMLLAKHDEKYMPPEVAKALEKNKVK